MNKINYLLWIILLAFSNLANANNFKNDFFKPNSYDITYGKDDAPIEVLEYYSLTCHHCSYFYLSSFPSLKKEYIDSGKVKWIKRSFTTDLPSLKATMLLNCVGKNRYESYLKILMNKQSNWAYQKDFLTILSNIASLGGMSLTEFKSCMDNKNNEHLIKDLSMQAKEELKIAGTPTFFINKKKTEIFSENSFREAFDKLLSK